LALILRRSSGSSALRGNYGFANIQEWKTKQATFAGRG